MKNSINSLLEGVRQELDEGSRKKRSKKMKAKRAMRRAAAKAAAKPKLGSGERFDDLVGQLKKRDDVKDPEALAAWIGRKKFGKERMSKLAKESTDVEELLVFEDVEDVLAFVEGLETLLDEGEELGEASEPTLDHAAMGAYRRAEPQEAPKMYGRVKKAAEAYLNFLQDSFQKERDLQMEFSFAANALGKSIESVKSKRGVDKQAMFKQAATMPGTATVVELIRSDAPALKLIKSLKSLLQSDEMKIGSSKVVA